MRACVRVRILFEQMIRELELRIGCKFDFLRALYHCMLSKRIYRVDLRYCNLRYNCDVILAHQTYQMDFSF